MNDLKKLVFLDLDGTLWNGERVPASAWKAIRAARAAGHRVAVNTGRKRDNLPDFLVDEQLDGYCLAGGMDVIRDGHTIASHTLDAQDARAMAAFLNEHGIGFSLETADQAWDDPLYRTGRARYLKNAGRKDRMNRARLEDMPETAWNQLVRLSYDGADLAGLAEEAARHGLGLFPYRNQHNPDNGIGASFKGEINSTHFDKGSAIDDLFAACGLDRSQWQVIAIGDQENDLPMFEKADIAVCMGNGTDGALACADVVSDDVDHDGLYKAFDHLGLLHR